MKATALAPTKYCLEHCKFWNELERTRAQFCFLNLQFKSYKWVSGLMQLSFYRPYPPSKPLFMITGGRKRNRLKVKLYSYPCYYDDKNCALRYSNFICQANPLEKLEIFITCWHVTRGIGHWSNIWNSFYQNLLIVLFITHSLPLGNFPYRASFSLVPPPVIDNDQALNGLNSYLGLGIKTSHLATLIKLMIESLFAYGTRNVLVNGESVHRFQSPVVQNWH